MYVIIADLKSHPPANDEIGSKGYNGVGVWVKGEFEEQIEGKRRSV